MRICKVEDYEAMSRAAADIIASQITEKPDCVLGLATGSTPIGAYAHLAERQRKGELSFAPVRSVNLDEYYGLAPEHEQSYRYFMEKNLFSLVDIRPENTNVPNGRASDPSAECARYDRLIDELGSIDLQLLGLGHNGHIGFNEPGPAFIPETHLVDLTESTINANARLFASKDEVPHQALTMGIRAIMQAKRVLVIVSGEDKAEAVKKTVAGPIVPEVPASILQLHRDAVLVADKAALRLLNGEVEA